MSRSTPELVAVDDQATREAARRLISEYLRWVAGEAAARYGLSFDVEAMVASDIDDPTKFYPPGGRFYLLAHAGAHVGVGCLKGLTATAAEIQRMYVQPHVRGLGAGRRLVMQLLADARAMEYQVVRLESLRFLSAAHALYRSVGFVEIVPYAENSMTAYQSAETIATYRSSAVFMELRLARSPEALLTAVYAAFNARDIDGVLASMTMDVEWPNGMEGGVVLGHDGVREYWTRQWSTIDPRVEPLGIEGQADGRHAVRVHQVVKDLTGAVVADRILHHVYRLRTGLIASMQIVADSR